MGILRVYLEPDQYDFSLDLLVVVDADEAIVVDDLVAATDDLAAANDELDGSRSDDKIQSP
jgi:hypothetical protein